MRSSRSLSQPVIGRSPSRSRLPLEFAPPVVEASFETPSVSALSLARERSVALSDPPAYWRGRSMSPAVSSAPATDSACINSFVNQLVEISENHSLIKQLERREYKQEDIIKVIQVRSNNISDAIKVGDILNQDRDTIAELFIKADSFNTAIDPDFIISEFFDPLLGFLDNSAAEVLSAIFGEHNNTSDKYRAVI